MQFFLGTCALIVFRNDSFILIEEVGMLRFFSNDRLKEDVPKACSLVFALVRTRRMDVLADRDRPRSSEYSYQNRSSNIIDHNCNYFNSKYNIYSMYLKYIPHVVESISIFDLSFQDILIGLYWYTLGLFQINSVFQSLFQ